MAERCGSRRRSQWCQLPAGHAGVHVHPGGRRWGDAEQTDYRCALDVRAEVDRGRQILAAVADAYAVPVDELTGPCRERWVVEPRHAAMVAVRAQTRLSLPQIGRLFDRHHTTVLAVVRARGGI